MPESNHARISFMEQLCNTTHWIKISRALNLPFNPGKISRDESNWSRVEHVVWCSTPDGILPSILSVLTSYRTKAVSNFLRTLGFHSELMKTILANVFSSFDDPKISPLMSQYPISSSPESSEDNKIESWSCLITQCRRYSGEVLRESLKYHSCDRRLWPWPIRLYKKNLKYYIKNYDIHNDYFEKWVVMYVRFIILNGGR